MGWSIGFDRQWNRDIGYGVPAYCDHPKCGAEIDRGLAHVCGGEPYGGEHGCGLYFCAAHLFMPWGPRIRVWNQRCHRCINGRPPYRRLSAEHPTWIAHKLTDESWAEWRAEHPEWVANQHRVAV